MATVLESSVHAMMVTLAMIAFGLLLRQQGIVSPTGQREMSQVAIKILLPAFNFSALVAEVSWERLWACRGVALFSVLHVLLGLAFGAMLCRLFSGSSPFFQEHWGQTMVLCAFCNATAMPLTLFKALVGSQAQVKSMEVQGTLDITIYGTVWRLLLWTIGIAILEAEAACSSSATDKKDKKALGLSSGRLLRATLNSNTFAAFGGLFIALGPTALREAFLGGPVSFLMEAVSNLAKASHPMLLLTLGMSLWPIPEVKDWAAVFGVCAAKLVAQPIATLAFVHGGMGGILGLGASAQLILSIEGCVPSAMQVSMMTQSVGLDSRACIMICFWQQAVALVTMTSCMAVALAWLPSSPLLF